MSRIGVFVCHCGINIAGTVDVEQVAEEIGRHHEVAYAIDYKYMCSDPGQQLMLALFCKTAAHENLPLHPHTKTN